MPVDNFGFLNAILLLSIRCIKGGALSSPGICSYPPTSTNISEVYVASVKDFHRSPVSNKAFKPPRPLFST
jgi:hypothetical protein